jgi:hypothetical protein
MNKTYIVLPLETNSSDDSVRNLLDTNLFLLPNCSKIYSALWQHR